MHVIINTFRPVYLESPREKYQGTKVLRYRGLKLDVLNVVLNIFIIFQMQ